MYSSIFAVPVIILSRQSRWRFYWEPVISSSAQSPLSRGSFEADVGRTHVSTKSKEAPVDPAFAWGYRYWRAMRAEAKLMGQASDNVKRKTVEAAKDATMSATDAAAKSVADADLAGHASRMTQNMANTLKEARLPLVRPRQYDLELSEKSGLRLDIYAAAVLLYDDVVAHRQAKPGTFARGLGREKRVEYLLFDLIWDARWRQSS
jgi:hypothetical protein